MAARSPLMAASVHKLCRSCCLRLYGAGRSKLSRKSIGAVQAPLSTVSGNYFSAHRSPVSLVSKVSDEPWSVFFSSRARARNFQRTIEDQKPSQHIIADRHLQQIAPQTPNAEPLDRRKTDDVVENATIPLDASSQLSTLSSRLPPASLRRTFAAYLALSKPRLSTLIVLTTTAAYALYPTPAYMLDAVTSPGISSPSAATLLYLTAGTALTCASANALNMLYEPASDALMSRTRARPLVRRLISARGALFFALISGCLGVSSLYWGVNPTVAGLGGLNIVLYAGLYTPMKRWSVLNTWIGALVGAIPPLMGWAAAAGQTAQATLSPADAALTLGPEELLLTDDAAVGGWLLAALLFAWQFPHFNALSWSIRDEYRRAGLRMLAWTSPARNARVALRYAVLLVPICIGLTAAGITDRGFLVSSGVANAWLVREAWRFWRLEGQKGSARGLFWASVWYLPLVMVLAMVHKQGFWERLWRGLQNEEREKDVQVQAYVKLEADAKA